MEWTQCLTIIGTTLGATSVLFFITRKDIQMLDATMKLMDKNHREDMRSSEDKLEKMEARWNATIIAMDAKLDKMNAKWDEKFAEMDAKWTSVMTAFVSCLKNRN